MKSPISNYESKYPQSEFMVKPGNCLFMHFQPPTLCYFNHNVQLPPDFPKAMEWK